jgi:hypothetical protein
MEFVEAVEALARIAGVEVPREKSAAPEKDHTDLYGVMREAERFFRQSLKAHPPAVDYLKSRGLSGEVARDFGIGYAPDAWDALRNALGSVPEATLLEAGLLTRNDNGAGSTTASADRVMFPIRDTRGRVIGFGGRVFGAGRRPQVPELAGNAAVPQGPRAVRPVRGAPGPAQARPAAGGGGLHGRGGPGPGRHRQRRGHPRHRGDPRTLPQAVPLHRRGGVLLRRRQRRPPGGLAGAGVGAAGARRGPAAQVHVPARGAKTPTPWCAPAARRRFWTSRPRLSPPSSTCSPGSPRASISISSMTRRGSPAWPCPTSIGLPRAFSRSSWGSGCASSPAFRRRPPASVPRRRPRNAGQSPGRRPPCRPGGAPAGPAAAAAAACCAACPPKTGRARRAARARPFRASGQISCRKPRRGHVPRCWAAGRAPRNTTPCWACSPRHSPAGSRHAGGIHRGGRAPGPDCAPSRPAPGAGRGAPGAFPGKLRRVLVAEARPP